MINKKVNTNPILPSGLNYVEYLAEMLDKQDRGLIDKEEIKNTLSLQKNMNHALKNEVSRYKAELDNEKLQFEKYKYKNELKNGHN